MKGHITCYLKKCLNKFGPIKNYVKQYTYLVSFYLLSLHSTITGIKSWNLL